MKEGVQGRIGVAWLAVFVSVWPWVYQHLVNKTIIDVRIIIKRVIIVVDLLWMA